LGGEILAIGNHTVTDPVDMFLQLPFDLPQRWIYPLYLPLLQIVAFERSLSKGLNPDSPKNLSTYVEL